MCAEPIFLRIARQVGALFIMLCLLAALVASPVAAAPLRTSVDDSAATEAQKKRALDEARAKVAPQLCDNIIPDIAPGDLEKHCVDLVTPLMSNSDVVFDPEEICAIVGDATPLPGVYTLCTATLAVGGAMLSGLQELFWTSYEAALGLKQAIGEIVEFIKCTKDYQCFVNDLKVSAVSLTTAAMSRLVSETAFDSTSQWWIDSYAAMAGLGLVVMAAMTLFTAYQASRDRISGEDFVSSLAWYLPLGFFMMIFAPGIAFFVQTISDWLSDGVITWMGDAVTTFLTTGTNLSDITVEGMIGGIVTGFMTFLLQLLGALGITATFEIQKLGAYVLGAVVAIGFGMYVHPKWRPKALRLPVFWLGIMMARPATLIVLGLITKYLVAIHPMGTSDPMTMFFSSVAFILAMILVAFAPFTLLKYFPLLPDGSESMHGSAPMMAGAALGAAGSTAERIMMNRSMQMSRSGGGSAPSSTPGVPKSGAPAPGGSGAGAPKGSAGAPKGGPGASPLGASQGASAGGQAASTAGKAGATAGKAGATAGKAGVTAGVGAATAGIGAGVMLAAQISAAGISKVKETAGSMAPDVPRGDS